MEEVFQLGPVDVLKLGGRDDLHFGEQVTGVERGVGDWFLNVAAGHADLVQHFAVGAICGWSDLLRNT